MNVKDNFLNAEGLKARAETKLKEEEAQTKAVEVAVTAVLKEMEEDATKLLADVEHTLAAEVHYDLDYQTEYFSIVLLAEAKDQLLDAGKVRERLRSWRGRKTFPFKIPNFFSRQNAIGAVGFRDGEDDGLPSGQFGLVFGFVEW